MTAPRRYRRFPYRTVFRWLFFFLFLALIPVAPWLWTIYWQDYYNQTVHDLNQSPSYQHDPGAAQAVTWHIDAQWPWVLLGAIIVFLLYLPIWWWARPSRDPAEPHY